MARRFRFALEPLLTLRLKAEEECKKAFAAATRAVEEERERRQRFETERVAGQREIVELYQKGNVPFDIIRAGLRELNHLAAAIEQSHARERQLEAQLEEVRQALVEAQRQRRAVELLKERREEAFLAEENRREQAELDETAIRMRARRLREQAEGRE